MIIKFSSITVEQSDKTNLILNVKSVCVYRLIIFPIGLALILLLVSLYAPYTINLSCDRYQSSIPSSINCQLVKRDLWGTRKQEREILANNYQLNIEKEYSENSNIPDYNVILLADEEKIKVSRYDKFSPNYNLWKKQSKQFNEFTRKNDKYHFEVGENNLPVIMKCFKLIAMLIIISIIILGAKIDLKFTLSKELNTLLILRYNSVIKIAREINLDEIENVFLERTRDTDSSASRIVFKLKSGENILLNSWLDSFAGERKIVKRIRRFLS
ncbi:MAG: hypothetical protein AAGE84_21510 [Cyanobacteria bacterium P01_G01_bin.39]